MVWYEGNEIDFNQIGKPEKEGGLPDGTYVLVRKGCGLVGGPIRFKSELSNAVKNTTLPEGEVEIQRFEMKFTNKIDHINCTPLI